MRFEIGDIVTWDDHGYPFRTNRGAGEISKLFPGRETVEVRWFNLAQGNCPWTAKEECFDAWLQLHDKELC